MITYGIDSISFYTSHYYLDLAALASKHGIDANKFYVGLGQHRMGVPSPSEDIVTLAANAAKQALKDQDINTIGTLLFATESGIDQSKAAGLYVHRLLGLSENCRIIEIKQACYSGTAAIQLAAAWVARHPKQKVLVIAADNARYGLGSRGESSQGCGAVAMVISKNPRVLALEPEYGVFSDEIMDFWRPNYRTDAFVDGHYSTKMYMHALEKVWTHYQSNGGKAFNKHARHLYHIPIPRLVEKAHKHLAAFCGHPFKEEDSIKAAVKDSLVYSREVGNCYTASLYLGLISLLDNAEADLSGQRIGFYSYGSGCVAEYFSGIVQPGYRETVDKATHQNMLDGRTALTYEKYAHFYTSLLPTDGSQYTSPSHPSGAFRLAGIDRHQRIYEKL